MQLLSHAVPVVGGLASFAAAALKAGDHRMQTRRVVKITDLAADAVECCSLARRLAIRMTDGLAAGTISTTENSVGGRGWNLGIGALPDGTSEEVVMEWFTGEVANREANTTAGRRLGKQHLKELLVAVGRGRLQGTNTTEEKVEMLLEAIAGGSSSRVTKPPRAEDKSLVESPAVPAPSHDGGLDRDAEFAALKAKFEALELGDERRQAKLEALELAEERRQAEFEELQSDNKQLLAEVDTMKKLIPKPRGGQAAAWMPRRRRRTTSW
ncbi:Pseudogene [Ectocarpus siliculosus]|nr:Pseudogene [Ectocarpus siliculosus]|eukprot:CBJ27116.1 Pseudogene [Ectocarpus siliculosus]